LGIQVGMPCGETRLHGLINKLKNNWFSMWYILMCLTTRKIRGDSCHGLCEVF
jgi:hypothetical protein